MVAGPCLLQHAQAVTEATFQLGDGGTIEHTACEGNQAVRMPIRRAVACGKIGVLRHGWCCQAESGDGAFETILSGRKFGPCTEKWTTCKFSFGVQPAQ